jgi:hypothetical protein
VLLIQRLRDIPQKVFAFCINGLKERVWPAIGAQYLLPGLLLLGAVPVKKRPQND